MSQEHADLYDVRQRCARRLQDRLAVAERLPCLLLNRRAGELAGAHVDADQARYVDVSPGLHSLAEQRRAGCFCGADDLSHGDQGCPRPRSLSRRLTCRRAAARRATLGVIARRRPPRARIAPESTRLPGVRSVLGRCASLSEALSQTVRFLAFAGALAGLCSLAAGCGGSPGSHVAQLSPSTTQSSRASGGSTHEHALAYARCMHAHGVPLWPDPESSGSSVESPLTLRQLGVS